MTLTCFDCRTAYIQLTTTQVDLEATRKAATGFVSTVDRSRGVIRGGACTIKGEKFLVVILM